MAKTICLLISSLLFSSSVAPCLEQLPISDDYRLEVDDPYHRHIHFLKPVYYHWQVEWSSLVDNFWEFLEHYQEQIQGEAPALYNPDYHMAWMEDDSQRSPYAAAFVPDAEGRIVVSTPLHGELADGKWMYVQMGGTFFVAMERKFQFHHTSLSGGQPVESAGTFTVRNGHLSKISLVSGHYRPKVVHGRQCLQSLSAFNLDLADLQMTYCIVQEGMVIKRKVTVKEFLESAADEGDPALAKFFMPLHEAHAVNVDKAELFFTQSGAFWLGNTKLKEDDLLCKAAGPFLMEASVKLHEGIITHVIFNTQIDQESEVEKMKALVAGLMGEGIDVGGIRFRIIRQHEKETVGYQDILDL